MAPADGAILKLAGYCRKLRTSGLSRLPTQLQKILGPGKVPLIMSVIALYRNHHLQTHNLTFSTGSSHENSRL
jgi:hypothetical protein